MGKFDDVSVAELKRELKRREKLDEFIKANPKPVEPAPPAPLYERKDKFLHIEIAKMTDELNPINVATIISMMKDNNPEKCFITYKYNSNYDGIYDVQTYLSVPNPDLDEKIESELEQKSAEEWKLFELENEKYVSDMKTWCELLRLAKK